MVTTHSVHDADGPVLDDGAQIAVIGGGPSGSFFSIFALKMAAMLGREVRLTVFEPKDFTKDGPGGCNRCGGIISELLVQTLAVEGINLPDHVVRKGINAYCLHTVEGDVRISTPSSDKTIATVYRGGGPRGMVSAGTESFDRFLLGEAVREGAVLRQVRVDGIGNRDGRPLLFSRDKELMQADLVVGAFGINSTTPRLFEGMGFGYKEPPSITAAIAEFCMGEETVAACYGDEIHLFLLPDPGIKFAAMIPKGAYVTLCILGPRVGPDTVSDFLELPVVRKSLPDGVSRTPDCRCLPKMNVGAPAVAFADRVVMCGDAGSTRLFKDGLGAAYLMGKAAAKTAIFEGVSAAHFGRTYAPVYQSIVTDNTYGRYLYAITDLCRGSQLLTRSMLDVVRREQNRPEEQRVLSSILWDMFTGNERYRNIFPRTLRVRMQAHMAHALGRAAVGRAFSRSAES